MDIWEQSKKELRVEQWFGFYKKYKKAINNVSMLLSIIIGALFWWRYEKVEQTEKASLQLLQAVSFYSNGDMEKAQYTVDHMPSKYQTGYLTLAQFLAADMALKNNDRDQAVLLYQKIQSSAKDTVYKNLAELKCLYITIFDLSEEKARAAVERLIKMEPKFEGLLWELLGDYFLKNGESEKARLAYNKALDTNVKPSAEMRIKLAKLTSNV